MQSPLVPDLFPDFAVTKESEVRDLAASILAMLDREEHRIVDLRLMKLGARSKLLYVLAYLNKQETHTTAQVLPRQRDGRMRLRVIRDFPVEEDADPQVFRVSSTTNGTALAAAMSYRLRSVTRMQGSSRANTVRLELFGSKASEVAVSAVERTQCDTSREICLVTRFAERSNRPVLVASVSAT